MTDPDAVAPTSGVPEDAAPVLLSMTCGRDRLAHVVTDVDLAACMKTGRGVYPALCGRTVLASSLCAEPGRPCPRCREIRALRFPTVEPPRGRHRWRRPRGFTLRRRLRR